MTYIDVENAVYEWVALELPHIDWKFTYQNSPAFNTPNNNKNKGTIQLLTTIDNDLGFLNNMYNSVNDNFDLNLKSHKQFTFSINIYGKNAKSQAEQLRNSYCFQQTIDFFNSRNIGYKSSSSVRDLTALVSSKFEERSQIDVDFYVVLSYSKQQDRIAKVKVKGDVGNGRFSTEQEFDI